MMVEDQMKQLSYSRTSLIRGQKEERKFLITDVTSHLEAFRFEDDYQDEIWESFFLRIRKKIDTVECPFSLFCTRKVYKVITDYWMRLNPLPIAERFPAKVTLVHALAVVLVLGMLC